MKRRIPRHLTRRGALIVVGAGIAGATMLPQRLFAQTADTSRLLYDADVCALVPEVTEGPYYFDPNLVRGDIREDRPGVDCLVRLQIVDEICQPIVGARVDIWHCDAGGLYSNYANQTGGASTVGETFLRGTQFANDDGIVEFRSIYPGWYPGRTTHIHFKVFLDDTNVLTGQIFFPEEVNQSIYAQYAPYSDRAASRTLFNDADSIAQQAGEASIASTEAVSAGYLVELIVGIDPNAVSNGGMGGFGGAPGGPGGMPGGPPPSNG